MKKYTGKIILAAAMFFVLITSLSVFGYFHVCPAGAQDLWQMQQNNLSGVATLYGDSATNPRDVRVIVVNIIKVFLTFVGIILIIMIILAGVKWMTAAGSSERVSQAKSQIINAIIGIIIILASYAITDFLAKCVFDVTSGTNIWWMCNPE